MNPNALLAQFDRISYAPESVRRLRRFVLDLAVRGKLVERDGSDEPAPELLRRIQEARSRHSNKQKYPREMDNTGVSFVVPPHWELVPLIALGTWAIGSGFPKNEQGREDGSYFFVKVSDMNLPGNEKYIVSSQNSIDMHAAERMRARIHPPNTIIFPKIGGAIATNKRRILVRGSAIDNNCLGITFWQELSIDWCYLLLDTMDFSKYQVGTAVPALQQGVLEQIPVGLPPLAEQRRIVAKVNELMELCDRLEVAQSERESRLDRLTSASHHYVNNGANAEAFRKHANFYLDNFTCLTGRPKQVKDLRQTILNLAICGRLVPQEPTDEPVSKLLKCITAESANLQKEKNIRAQKSVPPAENFEVRTVIPNTWVHAYLQDLAYLITDGTHLTPTYTEKGRPFLSAQNVKPFRFMPEKHRFVSDVDFEKYRSNRKPERGDVLLTRVGAGIGEAAVLDSDFEFAFYVSLCLIKIPIKFLSPQYLVIWLNSPEGRSSSTVRTYGKGASQGNLNLGLIRTFKVPLPPLAEQHRIVARVEELMTICDQLEVQLVASQTETCRLLESVLHHAIEDSAEDCKMPLTHSA